MLNFTMVAIGLVLAGLWLGRTSLRKAYYRYTTPQAVIPCAWCDRHVYPYMLVTLYIPRNGTPTNPTALPYTTNGRTAFVGCPYCADSGADYCGQWVPDPDNPGFGRVQRQASALEAALRHGGPVISDGTHHRPL